MIQKIGKQLVSYVPTAVKKHMIKMDIDILKEKLYLSTSDSALQSYFRNSSATLNLMAS